MFYKGLSSFKDESQNSRIHQSTQQSQTGTENNREENCEVRNTGVVLYLSSIIWLSERAKVDLQGLPDNETIRKVFLGRRKNGIAVNIVGRIFTKTVQ